MRMSRREFGRAATAAALAGTLPHARAAARQGVRFSCMLWTLAKAASFDRCVEMVADAGYSGVELTGEFRHWSAAEERERLARMARLGLQIDAMSGVQAGFSVPAETSAFLQQFTEQVERAKRLRCPQLILLSGARVPGLTAQQQSAVAAENLKRAGDEAARSGLEIVMEPIDALENPAGFLTSVREGFSIVQATGRSNVLVLYDLFHEQRGAGNLTEKLEQNIDRVGLIHVADVPGRHEPGTGEVNYTHIYRKLAELHYSRFLAMEYYPTTDPVLSLRQARLAAQAAMRAGGPAS